VNKMGKIGVKKKQTAASVTQRRQRKAAFSYRLGKVRPEDGVEIGRRRIAFWSFAHGEARTLFPPEMSELVGQREGEKRWCGNPS